MSNRASTGAGTRHSSRIAGSTSSSSSVRKRSAADPLSPPSSPKQRKRVDLAEMKELCNELIARRLRQLTLLRDRRQEMVTEQQFFRSNGSAVDFLSWKADVAPTDATLDAVVQTELAELDVGDIETRLLGSPFSRNVVSPVVIKQEPTSSSAIPSASVAAHVQNQLEVSVVTPTTEPMAPAMTAPSPLAVVAASPSSHKSVAVTDSIAVKIEPEFSAPPTPVLTPAVMVSATPTPMASAAPSPTMRPTATPSPAEGSVERAARQEAEVLNRIAELRRQGLWSRKRLPLCVEPPRSKTHWDYLLEEMRWMSMDFTQERRFKLNASRKFAATIARQARDKEQETQRAEQRAVKEAKRVCALLAKMVREFWVNVDKVVDFRAQGIIEAKKRKALDQHLDFIVGQADKFSSMVQEGMVGHSNATPSVSLSRSPSVSSKLEDEHDSDFQAEEASDDDERTIAKAERRHKVNVDEEVAALQQDCNLELDDILDSLPADYFDNRERMLRPPSDMAQSSSEDEDETDSDEDDDSEGEKEQSPTLDDQAETSTADKTPPLLESIDYDKLRSENSDERQNELAHIAEEAQKFQPKGYTLETTQVQTPVPFLLRGTLREYQHVGLDWLVTLHERNLNGILADEMGLGKTIQTIAVLAHLACEKNVWGPHLIVVPTSVILNWEMELKKWCPAFKILTYFGQRKERHEKRRGWSKTNAFHVCITSYKLVTQDIRVFKQKRWEYFVLDEAQNIKNFKSQRWQLLLNMNAKRRLLLTGTPLQNSLMELWSLMHFLMPAIFASNRDFKDWFSNPLTGMIEGSQDYNSQLVQRLHKVLRPFILRRLKSQVEKQLPQKHEHIVPCPLSKRQRYLYDDFMSRGSTKDNLRSGNVMSVLNIVMQLRKCCNHPNLFEQRPIVSPLALEPNRRYLPSMVFDLVHTDPVDDLGVPQVFRLNGQSQIEHSTCKRLAAGQKLIEEIDSNAGAPPPALPSVPGFKFVRPVQMASGRSPEMGHANSRANANHGPLFKVNSEDMPSLGLSTSDANHFWLEVNGERRGRVPIQMQLPANSNAHAKQNPGTGTSVSPLKPQGRVFKLVTNSAGERTIQAIGDGATSAKPGQILIRPAGSVLAASGGATSSSATPFAPRITVVKVTTGSNLQAVFQSTTQTFNKALKSQARSAGGGGQQQLVVERVVGQQRIGTTLPYQVTKPMTNMPSVSMTVREELPNNNPPSMIKVRPLMSADRTPQVTAQGTPIIVMTPESMDTSGTPLSADAKRPIKRKSIPSPTDRPSVLSTSNQSQSAALSNGQPLTTIPAARPKRPSFDHLALADVADRQLKWRMQNLRRLALENVRRLCSVVLPVFSSETIALFTKWIDRRAPIDLSGDLLEWTHSAVTRFVLYVHRAVADAPLLASTSAGRSAFCRFEDDVRSNVARRIFAESDALSTQVRCAQMLQFPELRLIEYDCGKLQALNHLLRRLKTGKHRCLIFTQMSKMLDVLEAFLSYHGYQYFRLDGATKIEQRQVLMERFNADPKIFCFILSTRSGGIGVNLTGADTVIFYDSDWNPTMDAQAQDRCHRIGQTRDVHIYRLISERTVEENILKKATQKRKLGEIAIEEAGFTPDYFKQSGLRDLFDLGEEGAAPEQAATINMTRQEMEQAMLKLEDTQDAFAAKKASEEARAELAEFDENLAATDPELVKADSKFTELMKQLKPIERYAINFLEAEYKPDFEEEVKETENMIEAQKEEWVKAHEKAMQGEKERQEAEEMADFDLTYMTASPCGLDEMFCPMFPDEIMPMWMPPSPPVSDTENDLYADPTLDLWYEREQMPESKLPSLIHELLPRSPVKTERDNKPPVTPGGLSSVDDAIDSVRRQSIQKTQRPTQPPSRAIEKHQRVEPMPNVMSTSANATYAPKSLFDGGPTSKNRTDVRRPFTPPPAFKEDDQYEGPEWSIVEDYALLLAITEEQHMTYNLLTGCKFGHVPNWDYVAGFVNRITGHYRSPRQCSMRYQLAVLPREEGRLVAYDPVTKKARKVHLSTTEVVHMKRGRTTTTQQFEADGQKLLSGRTAQRFKALRAAKLRRPLPMKRNIGAANLLTNRVTVTETASAHSSLVTLVGRIPQQQDLKLSDWGIRYSAVTQAIEHADYREERQLERKKLQQESARLKQQADQQRQAEQAALEQQQQRQQQVQQRQSAIPPPPGSSFSSEQPSARSHAAALETTTTALVDHQQMTATSAVQPLQRQASVQRQVAAGLPYTVVVSTQDSVVASGGRLQPISTGSYGQYPVVSRQLSQPVEQVGTTAYRQIAPQVGKSTRTPPSTPMPVNYVQQGGLNTHQMYATARSSSGQQLVQGGAHHSIQIDPSPSSGSGEQLQLVRPVVQQAAGSRQADIRPKMLQQRVNRVILTTTAPQTDQQRAYIVPQGQGMRAVQARSGQGYSVARKATLPAIKALAGGQQQSVATVMLQGGARVPAGQLGQLQQVRAVPRQNFGGSQGGSGQGKIPPIGMLIGPVARNETIGGSGTTMRIAPQQVAVQQQQQQQQAVNAAAARSVDGTQASLPPISLSSSAAQKSQQPPARNHPDEQ